MVEAKMKKGSIFKASKQVDQLFYGFAAQQIVWSCESVE